MKKMITLLLTCAMLSAIPMSTAFAVSPIQEIDGTDTGDVFVTVNEGSPETVYYVTVDWESLEFKYNLGSGAVWNPTEHKYSTDDGAWEDDDAIITVTNHSNADVTASFSYASSNQDTGITGSLSPTSVDLATGVGLTYQTADADTSTFTIAGAPTEEEHFADGVKFQAGTITVTLVS